HVGGQAGADQVGLALLAGIFYGPQATELTFNAEAIAAFYFDGGHAGTQVPIGPFQGVMNEFFGAGLAGMADGIPDASAGMCNFKIGFAPYAHGVVGGATSTEGDMGMAIDKAWDEYGFAFDAFDFYLRQLLSKPLERGDLKDQSLLVDQHSAMGNNLQLLVTQFPLQRKMVKGQNLCKGSDNLHYHIFK